MSPSKGKTIFAIAVAGVLTWWARLAAHSKTPPPEGRWREYEPPPSQ